MAFIKRHFQKHIGRSPWDFCWRIGVESTLAGLIAAGILTLALGETKREFLDWPIETVFIVMLLVAPVLETLLFQALPIFFVRLLKGSLRTQVVVSTILFAAVHFTEGITAGVSAGIIGGFYFGLAYAHWRTQSRWSPLWITTVCHAIHNGICFLLLVIFGNWA
jgi:hypothetical protein